MSLMSQRFTFYVVVFIPFTWSSIVSVWVRKLWWQFKKRTLLFSHPRTTYERVCTHWNQKLNLLYSTHHC